VALVITGGVVSTTLTSNVQSLLLLLASVAEQVSTVVPTGNVLPDGGAQPVVGVVVQMSDAVGSGKLTAAPAGPVHSAIWSAGHVMLGGSVSLMVTAAESLEERVPGSSTVRST
jgi:hypothetical protein